MTKIFSFFFAIAISSYNCLHPVYGSEQDTDSTIPSQLKFATAREMIDERDRLEILVSKGHYQQVVNQTHTQGFPDYEPVAFSDYEVYRFTFAHARCKSLLKLSKDIEEDLKENCISRALKAIEEYEQLLESASEILEVDPIPQVNERVNQHKVTFFGLAGFAYGTLAELYSNNPNNKKKTPEKILRSIVSFKHAIKYAETLIEETKNEDLKRELQESIHKDMFALFNQYGSAVQFMPEKMIDRYLKHMTDMMEYFNEHDKYVNQCAKILEALEAFRIQEKLKRTSTGSKVDLRNESQNLLIVREELFSSSSCMISNSKTTLIDNRYKLVDKIKHKRNLDSTPKSSDASKSKDEALKNDIIEFENNLRNFIGSPQGTGADISSIADLYREYAIIFGDHNLNETLDSFIAVFKETGDNEGTLEREQARSAIT